MWYLSNMAKEPENLVLELLLGIRAEQAETRAELATLRGLPAQMAELRAELRSEMNALRADVASDLVTLNAKIDTEIKSTRDQIVGLRRAVIEYHSAVVGHGILISELEARVRRVEQHLNLPSFDSHGRAAGIDPGRPDAGRRRPPSSRAFLTPKPDRSENTIPMFTFRQ
jgi:hypothetical protein